MSSLFQTNAESLLSPFNKLYKIKNKNKSGHKKILLNLRSIRSPDTRSSSYRKKSASKLFKQAHQVPSQSTQETMYGQKSENDSLGLKAAENQNINSLNKTRRLNTLEQKKKKITLKKKLSEGNNIGRTVQVCVNGETVLDTKQQDVVDSLTRLILEDGISSKEPLNVDLDSLLGENSGSQNSFELEIDSNLMDGNPQLLEWSQLIKRI